MKIRNATCYKLDSFEVYNKENVTLSEMSELSLLKYRPLVTKFLFECESEELDREWT